MRSCVCSAQATTACQSCLAGHVVRVRGGRLAELGGERSRAVGVAVGEQHARALRGEAARGRRADAAGGAGDQRDLALQSWRGHRGDYTAPARRAGDRSRRRAARFASGIVGSDKGMTAPTDQIPTLRARRRRADPAARLRRLSGAAEGDRAGGRRSAVGRLPPHRHGRGLSQRGAGRAGDPRLRPGPRRDLRHDQVLERRPGLRAGQARVPREPRAPGAEPSRPVPDPLAGARARQIRRDVEGLRRAAGGRSRALDRRVELRGRSTSSA